MFRVATATAALLLVATGCGNNTVTVNEAPKAAEAPTESTAPENEPTTTELPPEDLSPAELLTASIEATTGKAARGQTRLEGEMVEASGESLLVNFQVDAEGDIEAMLDADGDPSVPPLTIRIIDGRTYAGFPGAFAQQMFPDFDGGTAWLTVGPDHVGQFEIACASPLANLGTVSTECDPAADLRSLADAAEEATILGSEELRGTPTTHIRFVVPFANLPAGASEDALGALDGSLEGSLPVDAWIGADMLLRKMTVDLSGIFGGFAGAFGAEDNPDIDIPGWQAVIEYFDFDDSISIEAPAPESLVGDFAMLQGMVG
ncbi:MAG: hypothetical protein OXH78_13170 [Acidimicrobiaceae bacterium]|nr:hypothetical protein [Acidimicrobiaceae bacterium]